MEEVQVLMLANVKRIAAMTESEAVACGWAVRIAIGSAGGHTIWLQRTDGTPL